MSVNADGNFPPPYLPLPGPAKRRGLRWWGWALIVFGAVVLVSVPVLGVVVFVQHSLRETSSDQPFIDGPPQQPDAIAPLECLPRCFELDAAELLAVSADDVSPMLTMDERDGVGAFELSTVAAVTASQGEQWLAIGGEEECGFLPANAPYIVVGPESTSEDPIGWVQTWTSGDEMMDIAARAFPTTQDAAAFMRDLHERVAAYPWQDLNLPTAGGLDTTLVQVTAQAAIDVPDEVAAVGWVREGTAGPPGGLMCGTCSAATSLCKHASSPTVGSTSRRSPHSPNSSRNGSAPSNR